MIWKALLSALYQAIAGCFVSAHCEISHLYVVVVKKVKTLSERVAVPNSSTITLQVIDGVLVDSSVNARPEDCLELMAGLLMAQTALVRKMQGG